MSPTPSYFYFILLFIEGFPILFYFIFIELINDTSLSA